MAAPDRPLPALNPGDPVQAVRRFNRFYTRQIGVLQEHLLHSRFSLTEVRVLYELAHRENVTAVELCQELGLDRGYLSRMLQNFEKQEWIKTAPSPADRRRIFLSLTGKGRKVFTPLDRRSTQEVAAMLAGLSVSEQKNLLGAMREIESALNPAETSAPIPRAELSQREPGPQGLKPGATFRVSGTTGSRALPEQSAPEQSLRPAVRPEPSYILRQHRPGDMGWVVHRHGILYSQEYGYDERFEALVAEIVAKFVQNLDPQRERCWIAEKDGERIGAIFLVKKSKTIAKLRLLLVEPSVQGLGIGNRLVSECVTFARDSGYKRIVLWTQSELHAARHLYEQAGFKRTAQKAHQSWGRKDLVAETWELEL
jgi:DNA-binding MarR family transcriptional regulator/N-acetylglutamate synthase-like GNAT family acetyltransferase